MKTVPSIWYKETANYKAKEAMNAGRRFGLDSDQYLKAKEDWQDLKKSYQPSKTQKSGNLVKAKTFIKSKIKEILDVTSIKDKNDPYNLIGVCMDKFYLSNAQTDKLMEFMSKLNLLY